MVRATLVWRLGFALLLPAVSTLPALALTKEQARTHCRETVGRPFVRSCVHGGHGSRESCRARVKPRVRACIMQALDAANKRADVPVALPQQQAPSKAIELRAAALPKAYVAPPRTITDITKILDSEKPDLAKIAKTKVEADAEPPKRASRATLARFYYDRANARSQLSRLREALDDADKAVDVGRGAVGANLMARLEQFAGGQHLSAGEPKKALEIFEHQLRHTDTRGARGFVFNSIRHVASILVHMGAIDQAETYLQRSLKQIQEARTSGLPVWRRNYALRGQTWEADVQSTRAILFEARGEYAEAEKAYREAELRKRASIKQLVNAKNPPPVSQIEQAADLLVLGQARMEAKVGRFAQAEADARRALIARLRDQGKYSVSTPKFIMGLVNALAAEGRFSEAEQLTRVAIEINRTLGVAPGSQNAVALLSNLGTILMLQHKAKQAVHVYATIEKATTQWDPRRRERFEINGSRISALYVVGQVDKGIERAKLLLKRDIGQFGSKHYDTALARGVLAVGYMKARRRR